MKKLLVVLLCVTMLLGCVAILGACTPAEKEIPDQMTSADGKYAVAFVTDVGQLKDGSFNQGTWNGVKAYAAANDKSYKYYQPANGNNATDQDRVDSMNAACDGGAEVVVCAGFLQATALTTAAIAHPSVKFVFIDGWTLTDPDNKPLENVVAICFQEEQPGYLAGYAAVMEGYTKLGFAGGGGGTNPACCRYGYGFVQGAEAAAAKKGVKVEVKYSWLYGSSYSASPDLETMLSGWYNSGTEVIFCCGGSMCQSAYAAASAAEKKVIGVDVDQSGDSSTVITSAMKDLAEAVKWACAKFYDGKWTEISGKTATLGAKDGAVGLPVDTWSMTKFSLADYNALLAEIKSGAVTVDADYAKLASTANVTLTIVE